MAHVVVIWEARVEPERQPDLIAAYRSGSIHLPPQIVRHALVQDSNDQDIWRAISVWQSPEALEHYRQNVDTPAALLMFREAGAEPSRSISEVVDSGEF